MVRLHSKRIHNLLLKYKIIPAIMWNIKLRLCDKNFKWIFSCITCNFVSFIYIWIILTQYLSPGFQVFFFVEDSVYHFISRESQTNNVINFSLLHYPIFSFFVHRKLCLTLICCWINVILKRLVKSLLYRNV